MEDIINIIAENLDELDFDMQQSAPEFTMPLSTKRLRNPRYVGYVQVDLCLLDENGEESLNGDLYNLTDDAKISDDLDFIIPMLQQSKEFYGQLEIMIVAESVRDDANGYYDDRAIRSVELNLFEGQELVGQVQIPDKYFQEIFSEFENHIYNADVS
jgi:hypothetical protein